MTAIFGTEGSCSVSSSPVGAAPRGEVKPRKDATARADQARRKMRGALAK
jgi:hypothetical protein